MPATRALPLLLALGVAVPLGACAAPPAPPALDPAAPPAEILAGVERRLLEAPSLGLRYAVVSEGAFAASLDGTLRLEGPRGAELEAQGTFGGDPVSLRLRADEATLEGGAGEAAAFREAAPPGVRDALVIGLTRMGILHNLARLTAGSPPDHAAGGVREWVEVRDVRLAEDAGTDPGLLPIRFEIFVSGSRAAEATLWLDRATGLPERREQVVSFPGGSMRVGERYDFLP